MGGFFSALFGGSSPALNASLRQSGSVSNFGTQTGEGDINAASGFWRDILSGDPQKIGALLGPEFSGIQQRGQQQLNTAEQFHNRGGGENAAAQTNIDTQRAQVEDLISKLTGAAGSQVGNLGLNTLGLGLRANEDRGQQAQQQLQNEQGGIFGQLISGLSGAGLDWLTKGISGIGKGGSSGGISSGSPIF